MLSLATVLRARASQRTRACISCACLCGSILIGPRFLSGATWDGGGTDNNWTTAANWVGDVAPVSGTPGLSIAFGGGTRLTPSQNLSNPFVLQSLIFDSSTSGTFSLSGSPLKFDGQGAVPEIRNDSLTAAFISNAIQLTSDTVIQTAPAGFLSLTGAISGVGGLTIRGDSPVDFSGNAANTYTGTTTVEGGTLSLHRGDGTNAIPGNLVVSGGRVNVLILTRFQIPQRLSWTAVR